MIKSNTFTNVVILLNTYVKYFYIDSAYKLNLSEKSPNF